MLFMAMVRDRYKNGNDKYQISNFKKSNLCYRVNIVYVLSG